MAGEFARYTHYPQLKHPPENLQPTRTANTLTPSINASTQKRREKGKSDVGVRGTADPGSLKHTTCVASEPDSVTPRRL